MTNLKSDRGGALADGLADAVHGGVAAAHHDHVLALGVQFARLDFRNDVTQVLAVRGDQVIQRGDHALAAAARDGQVARGVDADGD